jgi:hypothetical protein
MTRLVFPYAELRVGLAAILGSLAFACGGETQEPSPEPAPSAAAATGDEQDVTAGKNTAGRMRRGTFPIVRTAGRYC